MIIKQEITNPSINNRLFLLINSIHRCASQYFSFSKTYAFGSRMSGLALKDSDVDLYFDIGNIHDILKINIMNILKEKLDKINSYTIL